MITTPSTAQPLVSNHNDNDARAYGGSRFDLLWKEE